MLVTSLITYFVDYLLIRCRFQPAPVGSDSLNTVPASSNQHSQGSERRNND